MTTMYFIKVDGKYFVGEDVRNFLDGEFCAYKFTEDRDQAWKFDQVTAMDYIARIMERQRVGFYLGQITVIPETQEETVAPIVRGEWIKLDEDLCRCSHCYVELEVPDIYIKSFHFCPNCGAVMSEEALRIIAERKETAGDGN